MVRKFRIPSLSLDTGEDQTEDKDEEELGFSLSRFSSELLKQVISVGFTLVFFFSLPAMNSVTFELISLHVTDSLSSRQLWVWLGGGVYNCVSMSPGAVLCD